MAYGFGAVMRKIWLCEAKDNGCSLLDLIRWENNIVSCKKKKGARDFEKDHWFSIYTYLYLNSCFFVCSCVTVSLSLQSSEVESNSPTQGLLCNFRARIQAKYPAHCECSLKANGCTQYIVNNNTQNFMDQFFTSVSQGQGAAKSWKQRRKDTLAI